MKTIHVEDLMNLNGKDEVGVPDEMIAECECGVLYPKGEWHRCRNE